MIKLFSLFFLFWLNILFSQNTIEIRLTNKLNKTPPLELPFQNNDLKKLDWNIKLEEEVRNYKGVPKIDSLQFYFKSENGIQFRYDLARKKILSFSDYRKYLEKIGRTDTTKVILSKTPLQQGFFAMVGFENHKQFIVADFNRNKDFSDDFKYVFEKGEKTNHEKLPPSNYEYETYKNGEIFKFKRKVILFPNPIGTHEITSKKELKYISCISYLDCWHGEHKIDETVYDFIYQGIDSNYGSIYIKPKAINLSKIDNVFNNQYLFNINDTITIGNKFFLIEKIKNDISSITLQEIRESSKKNRKILSKNIENFKLKSSNDQEFFLTDIIKEKKYTLLDFGGTWCGPCLKLKPKIIKLKSENKDLNIVSFFVDDNAKTVKKYIKKNQIYWHHFILNNEIRSNSKLLTDLKIYSYPTYILVNKKGEILISGDSEEFIDSLIKIIRD